MKKFIFIVLLLCCFIFFAQEEDELRFRVIANSDSQFDQDLKMNVVHSLKETLETTTDLGIIKDKCEYIISKYSTHYDVKVSIKKHRFKAKKVNGTLVPGGVYKTIVVEIGEAKGNNYWTILYPKFFEVGFEEANSSEIEYKSWFVEKILGK